MEPQWKVYFESKDSIENLTNSNFFVNGFCIYLQNITIFLLKMDIKCGT